MQAQETGDGGRAAGSVENAPARASKAPAESTSQASSQPSSLTGAPRYIEREFHIPFAEAGAQGLDVLEVRADVPGRHPLAIITHGTSNDATARAQLTPWAQLPQAIWFARRGYVALVLVRRGYGHSGGQMDFMTQHCATPQVFETVTAQAVTDLKYAMRYMAAQPEVDGTHIVSVGVSAGGFAQVALSADPPPGLLAAISFAGGRGGDGAGHDCNWNSLIGAFRDYGARSRLPMLWLYAENDKWFPPDEAARFDTAFRSAGGHDEFELVPPDGDDGHGYIRNVEAWSPRMEAFLSSHGLLPLRGPLPAPGTANMPEPAGLSQTCRALWQKFAAAGPYRAFATPGTGACGYATAQFSQPLADEKALDYCETSSHGKGQCRVVSRGEGR